MKSCKSYTACQPVCLPLYTNVKLNVSFVHFDLVVVVVVVVVVSRNSRGGVLRGNSRGILTPVAYSYPANLPSCPITSLHA